MKKLLLAIPILCFFACKKQLPIPSNSNAPVTEENLNMEEHTRTAYNYTIPLTNFIYYNQGNTSCTNTTYRQNGCLPASILMAAHLKNTSISVSSSIFTTYCSGMGTNTSGTSISSGYNYTKTYIFTSNLTNKADQSNLSTTSLSNLNYANDASRNTCKNNIKSYLSANYPVVALIKYDKVNKVPAAQISNTNCLNHFVCIVGWNETSTGTGSLVYYYDPNNNSGLKSYDLTKFLDAMRLGSSYNYYNYLRIGN